MKTKNIKNDKKNAQKVIKYQNEDTNEIKKLILILLGIIIIVFLLFFITSKYLLKDGFQKSTSETKQVEISYSTLNVGMLFNRPYEQYLVFAYDKTNSDSAYYNALISAYTGKEKIYTLDLSIPKNKEYIKEKANKNAKNVAELAFEEVNLIEIKNGRIVDFLTDIKEIEKRLK